MANQSSAGLSQNYDRAFHRAISETSFKSASRIWPLVFAVTGEPSSAVDFGCGLGTWLAALQKLAPRCEVTGVDHPGVERADLVIGPDRFVAADLQSPIDLKRKFDLCVSVEVAEHLAPEAAAEFVRSLTRHADTVLFSAAMPGQGGHLHLNEQWPSYWIKLFAGHGYRCFDFIRPQVWTDADIELWYRQNIMLFAKRDVQLAPGTCDWGGADIVHPQQFITTRVKPRTVKNLIRFLTRQP